MPLVSVILPTRDRRAVLPRAITSVLRQTETDFELIIVANGPAARDAGLVAGLADPRLRVLIANAAENAAAARNAGLEAARGEWVTFLDDDDAYQPAKLAAQLALARSAASPLVLCGARIHLRGRTRSRGGSVDAIEADDLLNASVSTPVLLHRASPVRFDATLFAGEDHHYLLSLAAHFAVPRVPVVAAPLVDVYQDAGDRHRTNLRSIEGWRAARRVWWERGARYSVPAQRVFVLRALVAKAKLDRDLRRCARWSAALLRCGGARQLRYVANALVVASGLGRGRFVT